MIREVHEIMETLCKIKAGRFTVEAFTGLNLDDFSLGNHNYADEVMGDDYYEEYGFDDYGDEEDYGMMDAAAFKY